MLPHKHFLIATLTIAPAAIILSPEKSMLEVEKWALAGGFLSAAIDLGVVSHILSDTPNILRVIGRENSCQDENS